MGDSITLLHKEGGLEHSLILTRDVEQLYGLAAVTIDGQPVEPLGPIVRDEHGESVIDMSRDAQLRPRRLEPGNGSLL